MLSTVARTEFRSPWRKNQALSLLVFCIGLSLIASIIPLRLNSGTDLWSETFLATQLLACVLFVLVACVFPMSPTRFLWGASRIGPVPTRNEWLLLAQNGGQILALLSIWLPLVLVQLILLPPLTGIALEPGFVSRSTAVFLGGVGLMAWGRLFAVFMPTSAAMLTTVGLVILGQFLLQSHGQGGDWTTILSPGVEFVFKTSGAPPAGLSWLAMVGLVGSLVGVSNLLSAWVLEAWHGVLCSLDQVDSRS